MRALVPVLALLVLGLTACNEAANGQATTPLEQEALAGPPVVPDDLDLDVPYVPTRHEVVEKMLEMAKVTKADYVIDLGSGDGRIPIAAAKTYGARGFGVDLNPQRIKEANENAQKAGVTDRVSFRQADLFKTQIRDATVLTMYLLPTVNLQLRPRVLSELRPGTRVVSHAFDMGDWKPDEEAVVDGSNVYLWIVPAQVGGKWRLRGGQAGDMTLELKQTYQQLEGTATAGGRTSPIREGRVRGEQMSFVVDTPAGPRTVAAQVRGGGLVPAPAPTAASAPALTGWTAAKAS